MKYDQFISAEVWWEAVRTLDRAAEYLQDDAGARDIQWTDELNQAVILLRKHADNLRARCVKLEGK